MLHTKQVGSGPRRMTNGAGGALLAALLVGMGADSVVAQEGKTIPQFHRIVIDTDPPKQPYYKMVGDLTGDGLPEIVVAGRAGPIVMYFPPDWKKAVVAEGGYNGGVNGELADINGDGRLDIVMGGVVWFGNPGSRGGPWTVHRIDDERIHDVEVADLTGDGHPDVVGRDQSAFGGQGNAIFVYYQHAPKSWKKEVIHCPHGEGLKVADVDRDSSPDIVIGAIWFRNDGGKWTEHVYAPDWTELDTKVEVGDVNGDGRADIVVTPSELKGERYKISWFECPVGDSNQSDKHQSGARREPPDPASARRGSATSAGRGSPDPAAIEPWKEHIIVPDIECVIHSLALGDFNQDGSLDVAYAEMHQGDDPDEVAVMLNFDKGSRWEKLVIDTQGSHDLVAADLRGDGALDIVGANHDGSTPVVIWQNQK